MINPMVRVRHVDPKHVWCAKIDPAKFWKAVHAKHEQIKTVDLSSARETDRMWVMRYLAAGPSFTREEIRTSGIATDIHQGQHP